MAIAAHAGTRALRTSVTSTTREGGIRLPGPTLGKAGTRLADLERSSRSPRPQKAASPQAHKAASTEYIYMPLGRKHEAAGGRKAAPTQTH